MLFFVFETKFILYVLSETILVHFILYFSFGHKHLQHFEAIIINLSFRQNILRFFKNVDADGEVVSILIYYNS